MRDISLAVQAPARCSTLELFPLQFRRWKAVAGKYNGITKTDYMRGLAATTTQMNLSGFSMDDKSCPCHLNLNYTPQEQNAKYASQHPLNFRYPGPRQRNIRPSLRRLHSTNINLGVER